MKEIGGYFELADYEQADNFPHKKGILLNTGRNALEYILRSIKKIKCLYLPYYTCEVVLEPINRLGIPYRCYHINSQFEIADSIRLKDNEYIIINNYFGIKDNYICSQFDIYGDRMIADCAQAFFSPVINGLKAFYSPRKFVGVADGGIAYLGNEKGEDISSYSIEPTENHFDHLFIRKDYGAEAGFKNYQNNEIALENQPIRKMSDVTKDALLHIDYEKVKTKRLINWKILNEVLSSANQLNTPCDFECPMVYPFIADNCSELRQRLISNKIFVARYWPNLMSYEGSQFDANFADKLVGLIVDQRYGEDEMMKIVEYVLSNY